MQRHFDSKNVLSIVNPWLERIQTEKTWHTLKMLFCFIGWYGFSSLSNNLNKDILEIFEFPATLTLSQAFFLMFFTFIYAQLTRTWQTVPLNETLKGGGILSIGQLAGGYCTLCSLQYVHVSFTHTIKSLSTIFTVLLCWIFLGETFSFGVTFSLIPIMVGVSLSSYFDLDFNIHGFAWALSSTLIFCIQNLYSKRLFVVKKWEPHILLFYTSCFGFCIGLFGWMLAEASSVYFDGNPWMLFTLLFINGFAHWMQNILAFSVLSMVSPLTYAVANTFKRVFVIIAAILYFGNRITFLNGLGVLLSCLGTFMYNKYKAHTRGPAHRPKSEAPDLEANNQSR